MNEALIIQLAISALGIAGSAIGALVVVTKKLNNGGNGNVYKSDVQQQLSSGADGTKTLGQRFELQVSTCNQLWRDNNKFQGSIETLMKTISEDIKELKDRK